MFAAAEVPETALAGANMREAGEET
jgi:hypothetical protein